MHRSSSSEKDLGHQCAHYYWAVYHHDLVVVEPQQTARLWIVFNQATFMLQHNQGMVSILSPIGYGKSAFLKKLHYTTPTSVGLIGSTRFVWSRVAFHRYSLHSRIWE